MTLLKGTLLGLKSLVFMYMKGSKNYHNVTTLSKALDCSRSYLHKVLEVLVKEGLLTSKTGPGKGYIFLKDPQEVTLLEVIKVLEGPNSLNQCFIGNDHCSDADEVACPLHKTYKVVRDELITKLCEITIPVAAQTGWKNLSVS